MDRHDLPIGDKLMQQGRLFAVWGDNGIICVHHAPEQPLYHGGLVWAISRFTAPWRMKYRDARAGGRHTVQDALVYFI